MCVEYRGLNLQFEHPPYDTRSRGCSIELVRAVLASLNAALDSVGLRALLEACRCLQGRFLSVIRGFSTASGNYRLIVETFVSYLLRGSICHYPSLLPVNYRLMAKRCYFFVVLSATIALSRSLIRFIERVASAAESVNC